MDEDKIREEEKAIGLGKWYHRIRLDDGTETPARAANVVAKFNLIKGHLPEVLQGATVLDVGANAGGMSFEFASRGAFCTAIDISETYRRQFEYVQERKTVPGKITFRRGTVYEAAQIEESYDIILFLGLIYHLRYPQLALDILAERCSGRIFVNTPISYTEDDRAFTECRVPPETGLLTWSQEPRYAFWYPSPSALRRMLSQAGFENIRTVWEKRKPVKSSASSVDNTSPFDTGQIMLTATRPAGEGRDGKGPDSARRLKKAVGVELHHHTQAAKTKSVPALTPADGLLLKRINELRPWHQCVDLGGVTTPGKWNVERQAEFLVKESPWPVEGRILYAGANAGGIAIELQSQSAVGSIVCVENSVRYADQFRFISQHVDVGKIEYRRESPFESHGLGRFNVILMLGLVYHCRHPQLFLDYCSNLDGERFVFSTQHIPGSDLTMLNQQDVLARPHMMDWHPSQPAMLGMLKSAGFVVDKVCTVHDRNITNSLYVFCSLDQPVKTDVESISSLSRCKHFWT